MPKTFSVLVVSFNTGEHLAHTLSKLLGLPSEPPPGDLEVLVFDNGSGDSTPLVLERYQDKLTRLGDGRNYGYAHAVNGLLEAATGDWQLLINGDVVVGREKLEEMRKAAESLPQPALVGFGQMGENGRPQLTWGEEAPRLGREGARRARTRRYARGDGGWPREAPLEVAWVSGSLIFASRQSWQAAGRWDETYFLYFEDADYCLTARRKGVRIFFDGRVRLLHGHGASMKTRPALARAAYRHAQRIYWMRHGTGWEAALVRLYVAGRRLAWLLGLEVRGRQALEWYRRLQARRPGEPPD